MKAGPEAHFLSGQIFTLGIIAVAVVPRMPSDRHRWTVGGRLSFPFRRALLWLVCIGLFRVVCFHLVPIDSSSTYIIAMDSTFETIQVIGQSFLCLTTAYILQRQLANYINIEGGGPGRNLVPFLVGICCMTMAGSIGSNLFHSGWRCLINLAEAISCYPVLKTLRLYTSVTTMGSSQTGLRGPVLTQMLTVSELWYLATSILSFVAEGLDKTHGDLETAEGHFLQLLSIAVRQNQDNGVDDWTRLLLHAVFLNSIDELHHVCPPFDQEQAPPNNDSNNHSNTRNHVPEEVTGEISAGELISQPLVHRSRGGRWS